MKTESVLTENLADFGTRERRMLVELLTAWDKQGLPIDFDNDGVKAMFNKNSGYVFLTNDFLDAAVMNGDKLESFYNSPYAGREGFFSDLLEQYPEMHREDQEWFLDLAERLGRKDEVNS